MGVARRLGDYPAFPCCLPRSGPPLGEDTSVLAPLSVTDLTKDSGAAWLLLLLSIQINHRKALGLGPSLRGFKILVFL